MKTKLYNKDFILMIQGSVISSLGDVLYSVAIGYWVYEKTGSNTIMGVMSSIANFMFMFLSPFTGSVADRTDRKKMIVMMDTLRGAIMLIAGFMALSDTLSVTAVLIFAVMASLCAVFFDPAVSTVMIDIIPKDKMVKGQSVYSGSRSFVNLIGKALSGALVAFFGVGPIIIINGISYLISAVTEMFISVPKLPKQGTKVSIKTVMSDMLSGVRSIFEDRFLKVFIPLVLMINLLGEGMFSLMMPFVLGRGMSVDFYGILMALETAGSLAGVFFLGLFDFKPYTRYLLMSFGFILSGIFWICAIISNNYLIMMAMFFLASLASALGNAIFNACIMLALPIENRGAIIGAIQSFSMGGIALSSVLYGVLSDMFNMTVVFVMGQIVTTVPMLIFCLSKSTREFIETH